MRVICSAPAANVIVSPADRAFAAARGVHEIRCVPPEDAVKIPKWLTVPAAVAAADVTGPAFAFTDGSATVAAAQFAAPTGVRPSPDHSDVPFTLYAT